MTCLTLTRLIFPLSLDSSHSTAISLLLQVILRMYTLGFALYQISHVCRSSELTFRFCVLARVLADVLGPTMCSTCFSGKVILISTVSDGTAGSPTFGSPQRTLEDNRPPNESAGPKALLQPNLHQLVANEQAMNISVAHYCLHNASN